jgi:hypothetical protein
MDGEEDNPVNSALSAIEEEALDTEPADDPDSPRDSWWLRWLKFLSMIVVPAVILGLGFLFADYIEQYRADSSRDRSDARRNVAHDSISAMKFRFWMGAAIGGGLGAIYVARCIIRGTDP